MGDATGTFAGPLPAAPAAPEPPQRLCLVLRGRLGRSDGRSARPAPITSPAASRARPVVRDPEEPPDWRRRCRTTRRRPARIHSGIHGSAPARADRRPGHFQAPESDERKRCLRSRSLFRRIGQSSFQHEVSAQQRCPPRMVLFIKCHLAAPVMCLGRAGTVRSRRAARMPHLGRRHERDAMPGGAHPRTQVHVLRVQEEPLVEEARGFEHGAAREPAGAAHPVGMPGRCVSRSTHAPSSGHALSQRAHAQLLPRLPPAVKCAGRTTAPRVRPRPRCAGRRCRSSGRCPARPSGARRRAA